MAPGAAYGGAAHSWSHIARQPGLRYRLVEEPTVQALIDGAASGKYDASIAALTITANRAQAVDFSQPFYSTGLGIAVPYTQSTLWTVIASTVLSFWLLQAVAALIGLALLVGLLIWPVERRKNEHFSGRRRKRRSQRG